MDQIENLEQVAVSGKRRGRRRRDEVLAMESGSFQDLLNNLMEKINDGIKSKKISKEVVLKVALQKISETDIAKIRKENISNEDKVLMMFNEYKEKEGNSEIGFYDFLATQMKITH